MYETSNNIDNDKLSSLLDLLQDTNDNEIKDRFFQELVTSTFLTATIETKFENNSLHKTYLAFTDQKELDHWFTDHSAPIETLTYVELSERILTDVSNLSGFTLNPSGANIQIGKDMIHALSMLKECNFYN